MFLVTLRLWVLRFAVQVGWLRRTKRSEQVRLKTGSVLAFTPQEILQVSGLSWKAEMTAKLVSSMSWYTFGLLLIKVFGIVRHRGSYLGTCDYFATFWRELFFGLDQGRLVQSGPTYANYFGYCRPCIVTARLQSRPLQAVGNVRTGCPCSDTVSPLSVAVASLSGASEVLNRIIRRDISIESALVHIPSSFSSYYTAKIPVLPAHSYISRSARWRSPP